MTNQYTWADNGYISPCPHAEECKTYKVGCQGGCYWCGIFDKKKEVKND